MPWLKVVYLCQDDKGIIVMITLIGNLTKHGITYDHNPSEELS